MSRQVRVLFTAATLAIATLSSGWLRAQKTAANHDRGRQPAPTADESQPEIDKHIVVNLCAANHQVRSPTNQPNHTVPL
jgi:hypothetical protein